MPRRAVEDRPGDDRLGGPDLRSSLFRVGGALVQSWPGAIPDQPGATFDWSSPSRPRLQPQRGAAGAGARPGSSAAVELSGNPVFWPRPQGHPRARTRQRRIASEDCVGAGSTTGRWIQAASPPVGSAVLRPTAGDVNNASPAAGAPATPEVDAPRRRAARSSATVLALVPC